MGVNAATSCTFLIGVLVGVPVGVSVLLSDKVEEVRERQGVLGGCESPEPERVSLCWGELQTGCDFVVCSDFRINETNFLR